jgi:hypothetical protein
MFGYVDVTGIARRLPCPRDPGTTYCQVPIIYRLADRRILLIKSTGHRRQGRLQPRRPLRRSLFDRRGEINE